MKPLQSCCAFVLLLSLQAAAWAGDECDRYHTSYDRTYCMSKLFIESDKELNHVYQSLTAAIGSQTKKELVQIQRRWMQHRNQVCQSEPGTINVDCNYRVNKARTEYLRDRWRECRTGACRPDMIRRQSW